MDTMETTHITGQHVKVTTKGRTFRGEVLSTNGVVTILDTPTSMITVPTASITKIEVVQ